MGSSGVSILKTNRLLAESDAVAWIERTKGNTRAASIIERLAAELRRVAEADERRLAIVVAAMRERAEAKGPVPA